MTALAHTGQRSAALAQFESCRCLLNDELAIEPEAATAALAEQIRGEEIHSRDIDDKETRRQEDTVVSDVTPSPPYPLTPSPHITRSRLEPQHD